MSGLLFAATWVAFVGAMHLGLRAVFKRRCFPHFWRKPVGQWTARESGRTWGICAECAERDDYLPVRFHGGRK